MHNRPMTDESESRRRVVKEPMGDFGEGASDPVRGAMYSVLYEVGTPYEYPVFTTRNTRPEYER